jgi:hypothetical protein
VLWWYRVGMVELLVLLVLVLLLLLVRVGVVLLLLLDGQLRNMYLRRNEVRS